MDMELFVIFLYYPFKICWVCVMPYLSILIQEICVLSLSFMASLSRGLKILLIFADIINAKPIN